MCMSACWAACLDGCSQKISREHIVSQALFISEQVLVQGFAWCREPKMIGLSGLTAKILCAKHNNDLSELDSASAKAFGAMREMMRLSNVRAKLQPRNWTVQRYQVDGPRLERWFLKTLINLCFEKENYIGSESIEVGQPSKSLVEICSASEDSKPMQVSIVLPRSARKLNLMTQSNLGPFLKTKSM